ncbi:MAG: c-type cytochrome domain-containing protein [Bacteroidia bacterium]
MKSILSFALALGVVFWGSSGGYYDVDDELNPKDTTSVCDTTAIDYASIRSAFDNGTCLTCHSGANADAGLDLSTYAGTSQYLTSSSSILIDRITVGSTGDIMPPSGNKLSDCNVSKIRAWLNNNFPE